MAGRIHNGLFVDYCAKDFLDATLHMDAWEELAYRRVVDMIYASNDALADDDKKLAWSTKAGARWAKIKASLIAAGRLEVVEGRLTNGRCQTELAKTAKKIAQKSVAGKASAESRNPMKNNETASTAVATEPPTAQQQTTNLPLTSEAGASEGADGAEMEAVGDQSESDLVWGNGIRWLARETRKSVASLRSLVGRWCSSYGPGAVLAVMRDCRSHSPPIIDPVPWIVSQLESRSPSNDRPRQAQQRGPARDYRQDADTRRGSIFNALAGGVVARRPAA